MAFQLNTFQVGAFQFPISGAPKAFKISALSVQIKPTVTSASSTSRLVISNVQVITKDIVSGAS